MIGSATWGYPIEHGSPYSVRARNKSPATACICSPPFKDPSPLPGHGSALASSNQQGARKGRPTKANSDRPRGSRCGGLVLELRGEGGGPRRETLISWRTRMHSTMDQCIRAALTNILPPRSALQFIGAFVGSLLHSRKCTGNLLSRTSL